MNYIMNMKRQIIDINNTQITDKAYEQIKDWQKENKGHKKDD